MTAKAKPPGKMPALEAETEGFLRSRKDQRMRVRGLWKAFRSLGWDKEHTVGTIEDLLRGLCPGESYSKTALFVDLERFLLIPENDPESTVASRKAAKQEIEMAIADEWPPYDDDTLEHMVDVFDLDREGKRVPYSVEVKYEVTI